MKTEDPDTPNAHQTAYFVFLDDFRREFNQANPNHKSDGTFGKAAGAKWKSMADEDKAPYIAQAEREKSEYIKTMQKYDMNLANGTNTFGDDESDKSQVPFLSSPRVLFSAFGTVINKDCNPSSKRFILLPYDRRYRLWKLFLVFLVGYSTWASIFELAFEKAFPTIDLVVDFVFAVDIILTFFVAYLDTSMYLIVDDYNLIAKRYLKSVTFVMDVASTLPIHMAFGFPNLLRLWRIRRVNELFKRLEIDPNFNYYITRVLKLLCVTILWIHTAGCISFWIANHNPKRVGDFKTKSIWSSYVYSIYWSTGALKTAGFRDLHAVNPRERAFTMLYTLVKTVLIVYIIGNMINLVARTAIRSSAMRSVNNHTRVQTAELRQEEVLQHLPKGIRSNINIHLFRSIIENAYLFKGCSDALIVQLVSEIKAEYIPPKTEIILQNEIPTDFFILVSGGVEIIKRSKGVRKQVLAKLGPGDMAGEIGVILNIPQPFTVRTTSLSQVLRISHHQFKEIVESDIDDAEMMSTNFTKYLKDLSDEMKEEIPFSS